MNNHENGVNFSDIIVEMSQPLIGSNQLTVLGGKETFSAERAQALLTAWRIPRSDMPWAVWEFLSEMTPICRANRAEFIPTDLTYLERARVFGNGGDLELRRDGERLFWRFIGEPGEQQTPLGFAANNYWDKHTEHLHQRELTALLWGERDDSRNTWYEARVGAANLNYEVPSDWKRVRLHLIEYSRAGVVELVRWLRPEQEPMED